MLASSSTLAAYPDEIYGSSEHMPQFRETRLRKGKEALQTWRVWALQLRTLKSRSGLARLELHPEFVAKSQTLRRIIMSLSWFSGRYKESLSLSLRPDGFDEAIWNREILADKHGFCSHGF